jgi:hypothetical protein
MLLVACAVAAFVPAAYFAGVETTRHMLGSNMATALAVLLGAVLLCSRVGRRVADVGTASGAMAGRHRGQLARSC